MKKTETRNIVTIMIHNLLTNLGLSMGTCLTLSYIGPHC